MESAPKYTAGGGDPVSSARRTGMGEGRDESGTSARGAVGHPPGSPGLRPATVLPRRPRPPVRACPERIKTPATVDSPGLKSIYAHESRPRQEHCGPHSQTRRPPPAGRRDARACWWAGLPPRTQARRLLTPSASSQEVQRHGRVPGEAALPPRTPPEASCRAGRRRGPGAHGAEAGPGRPSWRGARAGAVGDGGDGGDGGSGGARTGPSAAADSLNPLRPAVPHLGPRAPPLAPAGRARAGAPSEANGRARRGQHPGHRASPPRLIGRSCAGGRGAGDVAGARAGRGGASDKERDGCAGPAGGDAQACGVAPRTRRSARGGAGPDRAGNWTLGSESGAAAEPQRPGLCRADTAAITAVESLDPSRPAGWDAASCETPRAGIAPVEPPPVPPARPRRRWPPGLLASWPNPPRSEGRTRTGASGGA